MRSTISPALVYLAELRVRTGDHDAATALLAQLDAMELPAASASELRARTSGVEPS